VLVAGSLVALASWVALAVGAGNVGLQRSISIGAWTLFTEHPIAVGLSLGASALTCLVVAFGLRLGTGDAAPMLATLAVLDMVAGLVLAPLAIGELEPIHAPLVFASVSLLGLQIAVPTGVVAIVGRFSRPTAHR
jgi:hypothetical protein